MRPGSIEEASVAMRELGAAGRAMRVRGGGTKRGWTSVACEVELETSGLAEIVEHNEGDFTAVVQAGVRLAAAQAQFARAGQMLALDPPLSGDGGEPAATIGGVVATADSGPLRHRYGGVRDLVLGVTVVLSDGTVAKAGGRVIKNVAGYDLGKLFAGSHGTLGLIASVSLRLHPLPATHATVQAQGDDAAALAGAAARLAALPLEADCLDLSWAGGTGSLLMRYSGPTAAARAGETTVFLGELGLADADVTEDDDALWATQRAAQRRDDGGVVVKVSAPPSQTGAVLAAVEALGGQVVSRPALGLAWVSLAPDDDLGERVERLRAALAGAALTVQDGAAHVAARWPAPAPAALQVMQRIKARFDPARICAPGTFVGGS